MNRSRLSAALRPCFWTALSGCLLTASLAGCDLTALLGESAVVAGYHPENPSDEIVDALNGGATSDPAEAGGEASTEAADGAEDGEPGVAENVDAVEPAGLPPIEEEQVVDRQKSSPPAFVPGRLLVKFKTGVGSEQRAAVLARHKARFVGSIEQIGVKIVGLPENANEQAFLHAFGQHAEVEFAELDAAYPSGATANDPYFASQWHLTKIGAPAAWDTTTGSSGVIVAILDSGVDPAHSDLLPNLVAGWNFYSNNSDSSDVYGHGTAVAGTAVAATNNAAGVAAVAGGCRLMPIRVTDTSGMGYASMMASGLTWAADRGARVANMSFAVTNSATVTSAAQYFQGKGGVVTVSAGNSSTFDATSDNPSVLTVSATGSSDTLASWSNTGNNVDLSAPGVGIYTTNRGGGYGSWSGTSFAAPMTAGVAALVISANPNLTAAQVQEVLKQSANDLGTAGWDASYGWGRINAQNAVALALTMSGPAPDTTAPTVSIASPANGAAVSGTVSITISASDNVGVASVSVSVDGGTLGTDVSAPYSFAWNSLNVVNGSHTITATALDAAGNAAVASIQVTVNNVVDNTAPSVSITSPAAGATVSGVVSVTVNAADNVGVTKVVLFVDGKQTSTSTTAPFTTRWDTKRAKAGNHTLVCKAYDAAGNIGTSAAVSVKK